MALTEDILLSGNLTPDHVADAKRNPEMLVENDVPGQMLLRAVRGEITSADFARDTNEVIPMIRAMIRDGHAEEVVEYLKIAPLKTINDQRANLAAQKRSDLIIVAIEALVLSQDNENIDHAEELCGLLGIEDRPLGEVMLAAAEENSLRAVRRLIANSDFSDQWRMRIGVMFARMHRRKDAEVLANETNETYGKGQKDVISVAIVESFATNKEPASALEHVDNNIKDPDRVLEAKMFVQAVRDQMPDVLKMFDMHTTNTANILTVIDRLCENGFAEAAAQLFAKVPVMQDSNNPNQKRQAALRCIAVALERRKHVQVEARVETEMVVSGVRDSTHARMKRGEKQGTPKTVHADLDLLLGTLHPSAKVSDVSHTIAHASRGRRTNEFSCLVALSECLTDKNDAVVVWLDQGRCLILCEKEGVFHCIEAHSNAIKTFEGHPDTFRQWLETSLRERNYTIKPHQNQFLSYAPKALAQVKTAKSAAGIKGEGDTDLRTTSNAAEVSRAKYPTLQDLLAADHPKETVLQITSYTLEEVKTKHTLIYKCRVALLELTEREAIVVPLKTGEETCLIVYRQNAYLHCIEAHRKDIGIFQRTSMKFPQLLEQTLRTMQFSVKAYDHKKMCFDQMPRALTPSMTSKDRNSK